MRSSRASLVLLAGAAAWCALIASQYYVIPSEFFVLDSRWTPRDHTREALSAAALSVAGAGVVGLAAAGLGTVSFRLLPRIETRHAATTHFILAFGFIALSLISQALAYAGIYRPTTVRVVVFAAALIGALGTLRMLRRALARTTTRVMDRAYLAVGAVAVAFALIGSLAPEVEYDALWYHLWLPQRWFEIGRPVDIVEEYVSLYPLSWDLAYGAALAVGGPGAAKLLHFGCLLLLGSATWILTREIAPRARAPLAAALTVTAPSILWEATTAYADLALGWYLALGVFAFVRYHRSNDRAWLVAGSLVLGGAMAIKHLGLVAAAILGVVLVALDFHKSGSVATASRTGVLVAVLALAIPLPWYVRAYQASGNPVFPDLYAVFGASPEERWSDQTERDLGGFKAQFGRERTLRNLLMLPWDVTVHGAQYGGALGPLFLTLIPAALLIRPTRIETVVAIGCAAYVLVWASPISSFQLRFLLPLVPFLSVLAASGAERLSTAATWYHPAPVVLTMVITALMVLNLPVFVEWHDRDRHHGGRWLIHVLRGVPVGVVIGAESRVEYLRRVVASYRAWEYINATLPENARVLTFSGGDHLYSRRPRLWSDSTAARPVTWNAAVGSEALVLSNAARLGLTHVLFDRRQLAAGGLDGFAIAGTRLTHCCMVEMYRDERFSLYALTVAGHGSQNRK